MVLVLVIGDLHVPTLVPALPKKFEVLLSPGKIQYVLCTGNLCSVEIDSYLRSVAPEVHIVRGDMDSAVYPERVVVQIGIMSVGICHGHQVIPWNDEDAILGLRRDMGVDILLIGHSHKLGVVEDPEGGLVINPGSASGAPTVSDVEPPNPSFVLLDIQGNKIVTYTYSLSGQDQDVKVDRAVYDRFQN